MITIVTATGNLIKPDMFFWSQLFTWGESDLKDFELIFMNPFDAVLYFTLEFFWLPWMTFDAFVFISLFWWIYAAELIWNLVTASVNLFIWIVA